LSYAIQWFSFAIIALVGAGFVVKQQPAGPSSATNHPF
jgi:cytochrome oxidase assembly protein ShyY1